MGQQSLRLAENLTLPKVQVIVMRANMGCSHCRERVYNLISKMNVLLDYIVDFRKKEVTVRGIKDAKKQTAPDSLPGFSRITCCSGFVLPA